MKKLYKQFNKVEFNEHIEPMYASDLERERIKRIVMKQRKRQMPRTLSVAIISLVSITGLSLAVGVSNPALAANLPIIGSIFDLFKDNEEYIFENYDDYTSEIGVTQESNGVQVTVNEAVYDNENITLAFTIKSEHDLGNDPMLIGEAPEIKIRTKDGVYLKYDGLTDASQLIEKLDENTYAGIYAINLKAGDHPESIKLNWTKHTIGSHDMENPPYPLVNPVEGNWEFNLTLNKIESETLKFNNLVTNEAGFEVRLTDMTTTPIATSFYFTEKVAKSHPGWEEEEWAGVIYDYEVSDNLGNEYVVDWNGASGNNEYVMKSRIVTRKIDEEATSIIITPIVSVRKYKYDDVNSTTGREVELVKEPFELDPIVVPLDKE